MPRTSYRMIIQYLLPVANTYVWNQYTADRRAYVSRHHLKWAKFENSIKCVKRLVQLKLFSMVIILMTNGTKHQRNSINSSVPSSLQQFLFMYLHQIFQFVYKIMISLAQKSNKSFPIDIYNVIITFTSMKFDSKPK